MVKALTTAEVIAIVFAVIIVAALLYFLWAKGFLPFTWGISESDCKRSLLQFCSNQIPADNLNKDCIRYFVGLNRGTWEDCLNSNDLYSDSCKEVCNWVSGLR